jgi:hypothetical protein
MKWKAKMARQNPARKLNPWLSGIRWEDIIDPDEEAVSGIEGVPGADLSPGEPPAAPTTDTLPVTGDPRQIAEQAAMLKAIEAFKLEPGVDDLSGVQLPKYLDARLRNYDPPSAYSLAVGSASYPAEGFMGSKVPMSIMDQLAGQLGGQASLIQWADAMGWSDTRVKNALEGGATYFPSQAIAEPICASAKGRFTDHTPAASHLSLRYFHRCLYCMRKSVNQPLSH